MKYTLIALVLSLFISCNGDKNEIKPDTTDYVAKNEADIVKYIADNNLKAQKTGTGLYYVISEPGTGKQPTTNSNVTVAYKGYYTSKKGFDQSPPTGISFNLQGVIKGWTEGIPLFKEGGSGLLLIPAHLGYGNYDNNGIPGGSVLIFEVKLIAVN